MKKFIDVSILLFLSLCIVFSLTSCKGINRGEGYVYPWSEDINYVKITISDTEYIHFYEKLGIGEWVNGTNEFTFRFDGIISGTYSNGTAELYRDTPGHTDYYYRVDTHGIMLWSQITLGGKTQYYKIVMLDVASLTEADKTNANVFMQKDEGGNVLAAFKRVVADGLLFVSAVDAEKNTYFFDGGNVGSELGTLSVNGVEKYRYKIKSYNDDSTATLEITSLEDGKTYSATLDYSKSGAYVFIIGEIIDNS